MLKLETLLYHVCMVLFSNMAGGGRVVRWCWVNFQCRGALLIWIIVGQGPTALTVGASGGCLDIFSLIYHFTLLSPSLWETARYTLKYCLKPKTTNQPNIKYGCHFYLSGGEEHHFLHRKFGLFLAIKYLNI